MRPKHVQGVVTTLAVCGVVLQAPARCGTLFIEGLRDRGLMGLLGGLVVVFFALLWAVLLRRRDERRRDAAPVQDKPSPMSDWEAGNGRAAVPGSDGFSSGGDLSDATERLGGRFPALPEGTVFGNRYVVREVRVVGEHRNVYLAQDLAASRRCTVCSTITSDPDEHFCSACGADLTGVAPTVARYLVEEDDDDHAVRCERQLLGMQLTHPGLLLPVAVFEETSHGALRVYRVMPELQPPLLRSLPRSGDAVGTDAVGTDAVRTDAVRTVATVVRWGADLAQALAFLHKHQVALGVVDAAYIAVDGQHALWAGLNDVVVIPPEQRAGAHEVFARDVQALGRVLVGLLGEIGSFETEATTPDALRQLLGKALDRPAEVRAAALASGLLSISTEMQRPQTMSLRMGYRTDVGLTRELNEDSYLTLDLGPVSLSSPADGSPVTPSGLYVVADGMGGYDAGEVASGLAVQTMAKFARELPGKTPGPGDTSVGPSTWLKRWVEEANHAVHAARRSANSEMGTTLVAALVLDTTAIIANVGDSRCYHIGSGGIRRVTTDHSLVERLVTIGQITRAEADSHPQRNVIYRAIGDKPGVEVDLFEQVLLDGEALLLCSDGLSGMVPDERLLQLWRTSVSPQEACDAMVAAANQAGGEDNITAVIVQAVGTGRRNGPSERAVGTGRRNGPSERAVRTGRQNGPSERAVRTGH